jgi:hypothetical protein
MRPLWRETSTRHQNAGLKNESHRPHVHMPVWGPNVDLRTSLRPAASFIFHRVSTGGLPQKKRPQHGGELRPLKSELPVSETDTILQIAKLEIVPAKSQEARQPRLRRVRLGRGQAA